MRWSKSRIERAIQQADHKLPHEEFFGLRPDVVRLVSEMAEKDGDLAVLVHFCHRDYEPESVQQTIQILASEFKESGFPLKEDSLLWVRQHRVVNTLN